MINVMSAAVLAITKLRTRKIRTVVTVITASLLFSTLVFAVTIADGVLKSARDFTSKGLSDRYIVRADLYGYDDLEDTPQLRVEAERLYRETIAAKKAEAKKLSLEYDSNGEPKPLIKDGDDSWLDRESPSVKQAMVNLQVGRPTKLDTLRNLANPYSPEEYHISARSVIAGSLVDMPGGVEDFNPKAVSGVGQNYTPTRSITEGWMYLSQSVAKPFLLDSQVLKQRASSNDLPVIAPYSKVEQALKLQPLERSATSTQRLERIQYIREHAADVSFTVCYRNQVSQAQISEAKQVAADVAKNKNNKDYQKPDLIYGLPAPDSCGAATVQRDIRAVSERQYTDKQRQFERTFGGEVDPVQQKLTLRVVGLSPEILSGADFTAIEGLVSTIAGSTLQGEWIVPQGMFDELPDKSVYRRFYQPAGAAPQVNSFMQDVRQGASPLVEFANAADAKAFVEREGCSTYDCPDKPVLGYFGSNSVLIDDISSTMTKVFLWAGAIIGGMAALILMGMVGRVIADSRRETAVFRAIGARRSDIRVIYVIYTTLLSLLIAVSSTAIGVGLAWWGDSKWSEMATVQAQLAFVGVDSSQTFHLFDVWWSALALIAGLVVAAGLTGMLLPLSRNLARNPIGDMRDE